MLQIMNNKNSTNIGIINQLVYFCLVTEQYYFSVLIINKIYSYDWF